MEHKFTVLWPRIMSPLAEQLLSMVLSSLGLAPMLEVALLLVRRGLDQSG